MAFAARLKAFSQRDARKSPERESIMKPLAATCSSVLLAILSACGAGGGVAFTPTPPPTQTATPTTTPTQAANDATVELLATPATQELVVATRDDPIQIRYDASRNVYELKADPLDWSAVIDPPDPHNPQVNGPNRFFQIAGQNGSSHFNIRMHNRSSDPDRRYQYSNLASWQAANAPGGDWGNVVAFGASTPTPGVPLTGTASFQGIAQGTANVPNDGWGATQTTPVEGTVGLYFDFGAGTLAGSLALASACDCTKLFPIGTIDFSNTSFARGNQTFSGSFATDVTGSNAFDGRFTGPGAEELIGSWSLPFLFEGKPHQAWGAWVAKRRN